jgi:hypothetical protein
VQRQYIISVDAASPDTRLHRPSIIVPKSSEADSEVVQITPSLPVDTIRSRVELDVGSTLSQRRRCPGPQAALGSTSLVAIVALPKIRPDPCRKKMLVLTSSTTAATKLPQGLTLFLSMACEGLVSRRGRAEVISGRKTS